MERFLSKSSKLVEVGCEPLVSWLRGGGNRFLDPRN